MSMQKKFPLKKSVAALGAAAMLVGATALPAAAASSTDAPIQLASCNPCKAKKGCNPCAAKGCNPCAAKKGCNPCAAKKGCNPCAAKKGCNPCKAK